MSSALLLLASGGIGHDVLMVSIGAVCGCTVGFFVAAFCKAAGESDDRWDAYKNGVAMGMSVHRRKRRSFTHGRVVEVPERSSSTTEKDFLNRQVARAGPLSLR